MSAKKRAVALCALFLAVFGSLLALTAPLPLGWDEGDTFLRVDAVRSWGAETLSGALERPFAAETLQNAFPNTVSREGHPAGYVIVAAAGRTAADCFPFLPEQTAYRFGPILLFSLALTAVFYRVSVIFSPAAGMFALLSILLLPRVFVHAQLAFGDSILMSCWLLSWAFFFPALETKRAAALFGLFCGMTFAAKFSGLLAAVPFSILAAGAFFSADSARRRAILLRGGIAAVCAATVFYLLNPPIWHDPLGGVKTFFYLNTHRSAYNIAIQFLGRRYDLDRALPWWNAFFWTAVTVPPGLLFAAFWGAVARRQTRSGPSGGPTNRFVTLSLLLNFATLLLVRAFPGLPVHDGVRLFIAAFPFLAILAGLGLFSLWRVERPAEERAEHCPRWLTAGGRILCVVILGASLAANIAYFPHGLSYYNGFIGGLAGAQKGGMEATYYWDGLDRAALDWLNAHTVSDGSKKERPETVLFAPNSTENLGRLREWGELKPETMTVYRLAALTRDGIPPEGLPRFRWYVLQRRSGAYSPADRRLIATKKPVFAVTIPRSGPLLGRKDATALVEIYSYRDFLEATARCSNDPVR